MTRSRLSSSAILSVAIVATGFAIGFSLTAQACPFADGSGGLGNTMRQPDASNSSVVTRLPGDSESRSSGSAEFAGLGAVVGLFAIALFREVRRSRTLALADADLWRQYPQLEHPEMMLTFIPQEALPSTFDPEFGAVR